MEWFVRTPDGRTLAVEDAGDRAGRPVLVHVGTPNSRHLYGRTVADATARGLRLISYDRPGYGESTPRPGRTMADSAGDVRAICKSLGIERLAMWGLSGGGPHLLACAALLPDLVTAAASLCSPAPYDAEGLDWTGGFSPAAVEEVRHVSPASRRGSSTTKATGPCGKTTSARSTNGSSSGHKHWVIQATPSRIPSYGTSPAGVFRGGRRGG
jgi:pimeloyl-ACP methyl ester carboxylesterase